MGNTYLTIDKETFLINGSPPYSEIPGSSPRAHGLLMNARFIQGIFDDKADPARFIRWGKGTWDPERNTDDLIDALPQWYRYGLRAFTVGFQGGGPCFTIPNSTISNNCLGTSGTRMDPAYAARMDRLIRAADGLGMVVIASCLYAGQAGRLVDGAACRNAVVTASRFLREGGYTNVIVEVANEFNLLGDIHPAVGSIKGIVELIGIARRESGGMPVGSSGTGGIVRREVCEASDVLLIHGNQCTRMELYNTIKKARVYSPGKPVLCNEDSPALSHVKVAVDARSSWGYYNNATKQEPPTDWRILPGEDAFFALRMAESVGIPTPTVPFEKQYRFQGFEDDCEYDGNRWLRVASLRPESIDYVEYYLNGIFLEPSYDEPFSAFFSTNWSHRPWRVRPSDREWKAVVHLSDGSEITRTAVREGDSWHVDQEALELPKGDLEAVAGIREPDRITC